MAVAGAVAIGGCAGGATGASAHGPSTRCPVAGFALPDFPMVVAGVSPTTAATSGSYRHLGRGQQTVVAVGPDGARIELMRGVPNNDFSVSLFSHGPEPLEPITVLDTSALLYPANTVAAVTGAHQGRVPFATATDRVTDACARWELRADEVPDGRLAAYAEAIAPAS
jgi:hypothetical protein